MAIDWVISHTEDNPLTTMLEGQNRDLGLLRAALGPPQSGEEYTVKLCVNSLFVTHSLGSDHLPMLDTHLHRRSLRCCLPLPHCPAHPMAPFGPVWGTFPGSPAAGKQQQLRNVCTGQEWAHHRLPSLSWDWREELKKALYVDSERCWCTSLTVRLTIRMTDIWKYWLPSVQFPPECSMLTLGCLTPYKKIASLIFTRDHKSFWPD